MRISPVSFGKKVPIMQCSIKDVDKQKNVPATISEYDCQTSEDADEVLRMGSDWHYYIDIACDMRNKYKQENFLDEKSPFHFYVMENEKGIPVALCETLEEDKDIKVKYIESTHDYGHKYCGKTMLAALGKKLLNNKGNRLIIAYPLPSAYNFYVKGCGFEKMKENSRYLEMNSEQVDRFVSETELQTGGKIG